MTPQFVVRSATEGDNEQLLALTRLCPIEGKITHYNERGPRFFTLNELQGHPWYLAVAEDRNGEIVGCNSVALRHVYVDGVETLCLYGGDLKIAPSARRSTVLRQLYDFLRAEVRSLGVQVEYTTIVEGNNAARALSRNHPGMPLFHPIGHIRVCAINFLFRKRPSRAYAVDIATRADVSEIVALLNRFNSRHNFAPVWTEDRFEQALRTSPGLSLDFFYVAREGVKIVGMLTAWDQSAFQRTKVLNYPLSIMAWRYLYNPISHVLGFPRLPEKGGWLKQLYCTHLAIENDQPEIFTALLTRVYNDYRSKGYHSLTLGLAEEHPLWKGLKGFRFTSFRTVIYSVTELGRPWVGYDFSRLLPFHEISHV